MKNLDYMTKKDREYLEEMLKKGNLGIICALIIMAFATIIFLCS